MWATRVRMGGRCSVHPHQEPPTDEAELKALKDRLRPCHDVIGECWFTDSSGERWRTNSKTTTTVEIVPAKYDYGELLRWATILDRFAVSAGNTIGILTAGASSNLGPGGERYLYLNGWAGEFQYEALRPTIAVVVRDLQGVADALPTLLPLLGGSQSTPSESLSFPWTTSSPQYGDCSRRQLMVTRPEHPLPDSEVHSPASSGCPNTQPAGCTAGAPHHLPRRAVSARCGNLQATSQPNPFCRAAAYR